MTDSQAKLESIDEKFGADTVRDFMQMLGNVSVLVHAAGDLDRAYALGDNILGHLDRDQVATLVPENLGGSVTSPEGLNVWNMAFELAMKTPDMKELFDYVKTSTDDLFGHE